MQLKINLSTKIKKYIPWIIGAVNTYWLLVYSQWYKMVIMRVLLELKLKYTVN
jgi:hypothetical protein